MAGTERVADLFSDAWDLYNEAIAILGLGKPRVAAEVAWGATKRAADALVLARTGREPTMTGQTTRGMQNLRRASAEGAALYNLYSERIVGLHGNCFYSGNCPEVIDIIRGTSGYIREAERLAGAGENAEN